MVNSASPVAALRDAVGLPGRAVDTWPHSVASDSWLEPDCYFRGCSPLQCDVVSAAHALGAATSLAFLRSALCGKCNYPGEGPAHVRFAALDRFAKLRDRAGQIAGQSAADCTFPRRDCSVFGGASFAWRSGA